MMLNYQVAWNIYINILVPIEFFLIYSSYLNLLIAWTSYELYCEVEMTMIVTKAKKWYWAPFAIFFHQNLFNYSARNVGEIEITETF